MADAIAVHEVEAEILGRAPAVRALWQSGS
jgi:hypothetical protein